MIAYLTKDIYGGVELWKSKPSYDGESWCETGEGEVGTEMTDDFLDQMVEEGQCIEIEITKKKVVIDYDKTPEGKMLNAIFGK